MAIKPTDAAIKEELKVKLNEIILRKMHEHLDRLDQKYDDAHEPLVCYCKGLADGFYLGMGEKFKDKARDIEEVINQLCEEILKDSEALSLLISKSMKQPMT